MVTLKVILAGHVVLAKPKKGVATLLFLGGDHAPTLAIPRANIRRIGPSLPWGPGHFFGKDGRLHLLTEIAGCSLAWRGKKKGGPTYRTRTLLDLTKESEGAQLIASSLSAPQVSAKWKVDRGTISSLQQTPIKFNLPVTGPSAVDSALTWVVGKANSFKLTVTTGVRASVFELRPVRGQKEIVISAYSFCGWPTLATNNTALDLDAHSKLLGKALVIGGTKAKDNVDETTCPPSQALLV